MKKYLLVLAAGIFGILTANAWSVSFSSDGHTAFIVGGGTSDSQNWSDESFTAEERSKISNADSLVFSGTINTLKPFEGHCDKAVKVDFSGATFVETFVETVGPFETWDKQSKTYVSKTVDKYYNCMTFSIFPNCSKAVLAKVKTLCHGLFKSNEMMTTTFIIPETVTYIADFAVQNTPITNITIPENVEYIQYQAFQNDAITALIDVTVLGYPYAAVGAFDKDITVGQTQSTNKTYATLHFPEGAEDFFQNQNHKLDQATSLDKDAFHVWLGDHYDAAASCAHPNGWREFINSGSGTPEKAKGVVLRTYSDKYARLVPINFRAYVVSNIHTDNGNYVLDLVQIFAIPANTGVILYGEIASSENSYTLTRITSWDKGGSDYVAPYTRFTPAQTPAGDISPKNYMVPTVENTIIYPYYKGMTDANWESIWDNAPTTMANYYNASGSVTDRSFIMTKLSSTSFASKVVADNVTSVPEGKSHNYVGFFRTKPALVCGPNKAYLCLPNTVLSDPQSFEGVVVKPTGDEMTFRSEEWNKFVSTGNWGPRELTDPLKSKVAGDVEEVSGISNVSAEVVEDGSYYTLQGVKVAQPNKGIYIKNGKKIIIK